jgi:5-methylcytosine-specific restriction endonuclease McrA
MEFPMVTKVFHTRLRGNAGVQQRKRIRIRDKYTCQHCNIAVRVGEVDHIIPLELGGTNNDNNLHLLCSPCHIKKTAKDRGYKVTTGSNLDGTPTNPEHHWN